MRIVCSANMPYVSEAFSTLGDISVIDGRSISADDVRDAEILAVRSTTKVDRNLLDGSSVKFVGTATIGIDHFDTEYFDSKGIKWCYSPGCNANSVSEYITAALLCVAQRKGFRLAGKTIGVIGVGNVGSLVVDKAKTLGMNVLQNDPPRKRAESGHQGAEEFVELDQILSESDIITMHVPLTKEGQDQTFHLAGKSFFDKLKTGCFFINSSRGAVVDENTFSSAIKRGKIAHAVIDTWEGEPGISREALGSVDIGTPHIAGYSFEGKVIGTEMVYKNACKFLGREPIWTPSFPEPEVPEIGINAEGRDDEAVLNEIVKNVYNIEADDNRLREYSSGKEIASYFDGLRKNYPVRREFRFTNVILENVSQSLVGKVADLGFKTVEG